VPVLLSVVLIAIGWWVRSTVAESPIFAEIEKAREIEKAPTLEAIRQRPGGLVVGAGLRVAENLCYYVITTFSITYLTTVVGASRQTALDAVLVASAVQAVAIVGFGALSDRIGRRPVYILGAAGTAVWAFAFFKLLDTGATLPITLALVMGLVFHAAMYGPQAAFISELFPTRFRYSGASLAYQGTSILAGSPAPIVAVWLLKTYGSSVPISVYVAVAGAISVVAALVARETRGKSLAEIDAGD
jgi:MFS family permease